MITKPQRMREGCRSALSWAAALLLMALPSVSTAAPEVSWNDYLDHAYVYSAADAEDLRGLLARTTAVVGRSLSEYHAETFPAGSPRAHPTSEIEIRRKAISELLLYRTGDFPADLEASRVTIESLSDRLDRPENRYWYHVIGANVALQSGDAESFVDEILNVWLEVIAPLEVPFETYNTLALTENGNAGFVRTLPHLYESISRLVLIQSQTAALDGDIDSLGAIARVLNDQRVGAFRDSVPVESSSKAYLEHVVARMDGPESDGGSLSYTLALVAAESAHQLARTELAENGFSNEARIAIRDSVAAYQRALRTANTLQGQVAIYTRALRQSGEVFATGERLAQEITIDVPFSIDRAFEIYESLHASKNSDWERHGYVDQGHDAYVAAMQDLWAEIQETSFNAAQYYMTARDISGELDDESIVHAINIYSRYLHAFSSYEGDPKAESLPDSAYFGAYLASRGIGDGVLFFDDGDASVDQLEEAIDRYTQALGYFPFDRELWSTLAVAMQRSGRESEFLAVAKPVASRVVHSRHLDRWIQNDATRADDLAAFRRAFENDRSLVYFGFADADKIDALEAEFARLQEERDEVVEVIAATRAERNELNALRAEAHRQANESSGELGIPAPPSVTGAPPSDASATIAQLGIDLERLSSTGESLEIQIDAISQSLPIFKATLGHEDLVWELSAQRNHPVHALLRRFAEEPGGATKPATEAPSESSGATWQLLESWIGGVNQ